MTIKTYYKKISIKWKLLIILSTIVILLSFISMAALKFIYQVYDKQILHISSQMLNLYSTNIENELRKMEKLSFSMLTEEATQANIIEINSSESSYRRYQAIDGIRSRMLEAAQTEGYISSISYFDVKGNEYTVGNSVTPFIPEYLNYLMARLEASSGEIMWVEPMDEDTSFIAARKLRTTNNLQPIGYFVVRINMKLLVQWISSTWPDFQGELLILSRDKQEIYKDATLQDITFTPGEAEDSSFREKGKDSPVFFVTSLHSIYTYWSYYTFVPYESIFQSVLIMRTAMAIVFSVLILLVFIIGLKFSESITKPIIKLSNRMRKVEEEDFENTRLTIYNSEGGDEISRLYRDFVFMVNKINTLIKENYVKQLLIKETELRALQAQINPHFLYNTLESINWEAKINKQQKIADMVKALGGMLRKVTTSSKHVSTIGEELQLLQEYMTIQGYRFEERLIFEVLCGDDLRNQDIVRMSLQPVVENSIKYGVERKSGTCHIKVQIMKQGNDIEINIIDNGPGIDSTTLKLVQLGTIQTSGSGIGLRNIDERIKLTFGVRYGVHITSEEGKGTCVTIKIPYQKGGDSNV